MKIKLSILSFLFTILVLNGNIQAQTLTEKIRINQVGFFTEGIKKAIAIDFVETNFEIWTSDHTQKVFSGILTRSFKWDESGETNIQIADFSSFKHEGSYIIVIGDKKSYPFVIANNALDTVAKAQMKYYYYNRSSTALLPEYAGKWARNAGHMNTAVKVLEDQTRTVSMPGGWYDAGDYNLYMETGSMAACQIMMSYEQFPEYWNKSEWNIPESGNGVPDILDEVKWELRWMYKMKDTDNGVWYKASEKTFNGFIKPENDKIQYYCMVKNATSAYDFAATFALAARLFENYSTQYPGFADSCINAAKDAWEWGVAHETTNPGCLNPTGVSTGEYGDNIADNGNDNKVLAGVELFLTTGDSDYLLPIESTALNGFVNGEANWYEKRPVACMQLALHGNIAAKNAVIEYANKQIDLQNNSGYNINIGDTKFDFNWGSNRRISNRGMVMMVAYVITKDVKYLNGVTNSMDYILGRNATGYCFITGFGSKQVMFPHHRISGSDGVTEPQPGLPIQGSYYGIMGQCTPNIVSEFAAKNYIDSECSYSTNELSIDQGSPNVFNLGGLNTFLGKSINVEITEPLQNTTFSEGAPVTITAIATTQNSTITRVDFYNNNQLINSDVMEPYSYQITNLPNAEYSITAIAYNTENDSSIVNSIVTVGNASPKLTIDEPIHNTLYTPNQSVNVKTYALDIDGTISKVEFYLNNSLVHTSTQLPYDYIIPSLSEGISTLKVIAYDDKDSSTTKEITVQAKCDNLIENGEFDNSTTAWLLKNATPGNATMSVVQPGISGSNAMQVSISNKGTNSSQIQLQQHLPIRKGNSYQISYFAKADVSTVFECNVQHESDLWDPWVKYVSVVDSLKTYPQLFSHSFVATEDDDSTKLKFFLGATAVGNVYFDNIQVSLCPIANTEIKELAFVESQKEVFNTYTPPYILKNNDGIIVKEYPIPEIVWSTSDNSIVSIDAATGKITTNAIGNAVITATLASNPLITDEINISVTTLVGLSDELKLSVSVVPTITKDFISINSDEQIVSIQVIALNGQVVSNILCSSNQFDLNVKDISTGQYILKIKSQNNKLAYFNIIKQ